MQEHLKRIMIPVADGSTHELVIPEETDYRRMEAYAREQAATVRADLQRGVDNNFGLIEGLRSTCEQQAHRIDAQEESLARLHHELVIKPRLIARLVAIGYGDEEADAVVSPLTMEEAGAKVALREGLASIGYTPTETEECLEDVPALTQEDIDYARGLMEAYDPATTALTKTWHGDTRMVVFPKMDTSNVKSISQAWGDCSNLRYIPLLDTSGVTFMLHPFLGDGGTAKSARLRRVPQFDYSSLTSCNGVMCSFLPELEIVPPIDFPKLAALRNIFAEDTKLTTIPPLSYTDKVTYFGGMFMGCSSLSYLPVTDFGNATWMGSMYQGVAVLADAMDLGSVTLRGSAPVVDLRGLFQQARVSQMPVMDFNDVNNFSYMFAWSPQTPRVIPDLSAWKSVSSLVWTLCAYDVQSLERIEGLDFSSVADTSYFLRAAASPRYWPNLRFIRVLNLGKGSCATYDFSHARYWGKDTPDHPDARKSLVDTLLTDSYDRAAAGLPPATIRLSPTVRNRLTAEELAAITAKGFTLS